jgi:membrane-bound lytic murein transglycosylase D
MYLRLRIRGHLPGNLALFGAIVLLAGCVSQPAAVDYYVRTEYQISAQDAEPIRPTLDVIVLGGGHGYRSASYGGSNLWGRVRSRMALRIAHNPRVDKEIRRLKPNPRYLEQLSKRAGPYLHLIMNEIERRGMPAELALLPEIESQYNPRALSPKSAAGMWQFIPGTGRRYGLKQNGWYDGRNDIVASTHAALDYLQWLHREFRGDWALALAGYNAGEGAVAAARRRNRSRGKGTDFWSLDLPSETEHYVPRLMAVAKLVQKPQRYGMRPPHIPNGPQLELVDMGRQMDLSRAAKLSGVRLADLRRLNPGLKQGKTLPAGPHRLLVPIGSGRGLRAKSSKSQLRLPTIAQGGMS